MHRQARTIAIAALTLFAGVPSVLAQDHQVGEDIMCNMAMSPGDDNYERVQIYEVYTPGQMYKVRRQSGMEGYCSTEWIRPVTSSDPVWSEPEKDDFSWLYAKPDALGAPPSATYQCGKISGSSYMLMGQLSIQGSSYRGLSDSAAAGSISVNSDNTLTLDQGLEGISETASITDVRYFRSTDNRDVVRVAYTSPAGSAEEIDCLIE